MINSEPSVTQVTNTKQFQSQPQRHHNSPLTVVTSDPQINLANFKSTSHVSVSTSANAIADTNHFPLNLSTSGTTKNTDSATLSIITSHMKQNAQRTSQAVSDYKSKCDTSSNKIPSSTAAKMYESTNGSTATSSITAHAVAAATTENLNKSVVSSSPSIQAPKPSGSIGDEAISPRNDSASACEDEEGELADDESFSPPARSNLFERINMLAKMAESDRKVKEKEASRPGSSFKSSPSESSENRTFTEQKNRESPDSRHQISPSNMKPETMDSDGIEVIAIEFSDSPKKMFDHTHFDDSVQSTKSDDSGVATTMDIEDDSVDLTPKSANGILTPSSSPSQISPAGSQSRCAVSASSDKYGSPTASPKICVSKSQPDGESGAQKCICVNSDSNRSQNASPSSDYHKTSSSGNRLINSSCQTTETGSMTVESSLLFPARIAPSIIEPRTMLRIPKDFTVQPTDLSSSTSQSPSLPPCSPKAIDGRENNATSSASPSSFDLEPKMTLCLPVSHLGKQTTGQMSGESNPELLSAAKSHASKSQRNLPTPITITSKPFQPNHQPSITINAVDSSTSSPVQVEAIYLGRPSPTSTTTFSVGHTCTDSSPLISSSARCATPDYSGTKKAPKESASKKNKMPGFIQERNSSVQSMNISRQSSVSSTEETATKQSGNSGVVSNVHSVKSKSLQPLKLTVTLSGNGDMPIKISPSPNESNKDGKQITTNSINRSLLNKSSGSSTKSLHSVARIIAPSSSSSPLQPSISPSPSPSPPSKTSKINTNVIQTTKISTLIPKSSTHSSKSNSFKQFAYPSSINTVPSSRSFLLPNSLAHFSHADMIGLINTGAIFHQNAIEKNAAVLSSFPSVSVSASSSSSLPSSSFSGISSNSSSRNYHHHQKVSSSSSSSSKHKDGSEKHSKNKTIPPLSIPKKCLISPPLKLQRSPGSTDHYVFSPQNPYLSSTAPISSSSSATGISHSTEKERARHRSKEGKHNASRSSSSSSSNTSASASANNDGERQRVPKIKISDINRNPIIVDSDPGSSNRNPKTSSSKNSNSKHNNSNSNSNNTGQATPSFHRSQSHTGSKSETSGASRRKGGGGGGSSSSHPSISMRPSSASASTSTPLPLSSSPVPPIPRSIINKDPRLPSESELLIHSPWHIHSAAAEFLLRHPFTKFQNLHYDTDAMPLDYSQSSSRL